VSGVEIRVGVGVLKIEGSESEALCTASTAQFYAFVVDHISLPHLRTLSQSNAIIYMKVMLTYRISAFSYIIGPWWTFEYILENNEKGREKRTEVNDDKRRL
jgi:hypothetical protein